MEQTKISELSNLLKVASHYDATVSSTTLCLCVKSGSSSDPLGKNGLAHLLEHTLFGAYSQTHRSDIYSGIANQEFALTAFTELENTCFVINFINRDKLQACVDVLWNIFSGIWLSKQGLIDAKSDICREIDTLSQDKDETLFDSLNAICFPKQSYGRPIVGSYKTISELQIEDLQDFLKQEYVAANTLICMVGNIEHQQLVDCVDNKFATLPFLSKCLVGAPQWGGGIKKVGQKDNQTRVAISLAFKASGARDYYLFWLASYILTAETITGFQSALKLNSSDRHDLYIYPEFLSNLGRMNFYFRVQSSNGVAVIDKIRHQLRSNTKTKLTNLIAQLKQPDIKQFLQFIELKNSKLEHLTMCLSHYQLLPSDVPLPHAHIEMQDSLISILESLYTPDLEAIAYTA